MSEWTLTITRPCPTCKGGGEKPFHQWCRECGQPYGPGELGEHGPFQRNDNPTLPCGHSAYSLNEENYCEDCEDEGFETRVVTLREAARIAAEEAANAPR
jgi:hypothetical protein